jgi:hypothetical protein
MALFAGVAVVSDKHDATCLLPGHLTIPQGAKLNRPELPSGKF